jgi:hypothetical protein
MGDRTYVNMHVHKDDLNHPAWLEFIEHNGEPVDSYKPGQWLITEANYGLYEDRAHLAEKGVRFYGDHGSGCEYNQAMFYGADGTWDDREGDGTGIVVSIGAGLRIDLADVERANKFLAEYEKVMKLVDDSYEVPGS